jgi:hypothetical protein
MHELVAALDEPAERVSRRSAFSVSLGSLFGGGVRGDDLRRARSSNSPSLAPARNAAISALV